MIELQFYPTPLALATKMWGKFLPEFRHGKLLEPSAGDGALLQPIFERNREGYDGNIRRARQVDVIEIDPARRALLNERFTVVGEDFLRFAALEVYSRIIMNPPFAVGVDHVLHAWDGLVNGQIVAIINAESVRNDFSENRKRLNRLIARYGSVEYLQDEFIEAERSTPVEVALISLVKHNGRDAQLDAVKEWLLTAQVDDNEPYVKPTLSGTEVANVGRYVEEQVATFDQTVNLIKKMDSLDGLRSQLLRRLGENFATKYASQEKDGKGSASKEPPKMSASVPEQIADARERAWLAIVDSSGVNKVASSKMKEEIHASMSSLVKVPFTVDNVNAFLQSVLEAAPAMLNGVLDAGFNAFTRYASDNVYYYRGWKSNDKHRKFGMKLKATRFILPRITSYSYYEDERNLGEFVRAMNYLDHGKLLPLGDRNCADAQAYSAAKKSPAVRIAGVYADYRYYAGTQTMHIFPRRADLVEALNLNVARRNRWLPPTDTMDHCWKAAYDAAEQTDKAIRSMSKRYYVNLVGGHDPETVDKVAAKVDEYYVEQGIWKALPDLSANDQEADSQPSRLPLLMAA